ncbi:MAG: tRNA pseudouridine(13) synthase TruD [Phycisphaerales bacterium]
MTIRRVPSDFRVREVLRAEPGQADAPGGLVVYELTKESLTTPEAISKFAAALGVRAADCSYAGLKDKHALTTQFVAVRAPGPSPVQRLGGDRWSACVTGLRSTHLSARDIERNEFQITVRDLTPEASARMDTLAAGLRKGDGLHVVNYFGEQRFGSARHGEGFAARHLVRGEFEVALRLLIGTPHRKDAGAQRAFTRGLAAGWGRWTDLAATLPRCPQRKAVELLAERAAKRPLTPHDFRDAFAVLPYLLQEICVDAWQSHLWNRIVEDGAHTGLALAGSSVDLPCPHATYAEPWKPAAEAVLVSEAVSLADLRIPGLRRPAFSHAARAVLVRAGGFALSDPEPDELSPARGAKAPPRCKRCVCFTLPSGAYATVVLRAIGQ